MGVPAFFRWLTKKYPSVIVNCVEEKRIDVDGVKIPIDTLEANSNGVEFDNLYLDMNGIIHPCTHPEDKPAPRNEDEMMIAIFDCIDRLFNIVRPRKLLYMAIDGVAPRAKMNQQRSRRFRAIKETVEKFNEISKAREELLQRGATLPPKKSEGEHFDSNCITPGTPFMARLSECLNYYIHDKVNNDPGWSNIKVILSDANVPGEGEHKIMDFIRKQRAQPDHDPNTHHCLCGADADLIMLGLATHEVNFTIIREEFKPNKPKPCDLCGQIGHAYKECEGGEIVESSKSAKLEAEQEYIFVRLNVLREYLERELYMPNLSFEYDFERAIDDWVFMCFFVGNDFLPHLPSLEIREGAIDKLIKLYKDVVYKTKGYLTKNGDASLDRVQLIMLELGKSEEQTFRKRHQDELNFKGRERKKKRTQNYDWNYARNTQLEPQTLANAVVPINNPRQQMYQIRKANMNNNADVQSNTSLELTKRGTKRTRDETDNEEKDSHDEVKLWEEGFKDRYYESKFDVGKDNLQFRYNVGLQYVRGLCWVLQYYYQGCPSWKWYFPYHYAPFASDFVNISGLSTKFETKTKPFNPLEQLMSVFPASSRSHVPLAWADLMINETSSIIDFYPDDFKIDLNGKQFAWQGVALLPFVDEKRLFRELAKVYDKLTSAEMERNALGDERLYIGIQHEQYQTFAKLSDVGVESGIVIDGIQGTILPCKKQLDNRNTLQSPLKCLPPIEDSRVCCVSFRCLKYSEDFIFPSIRLKGACEPLRVLKPEDFEQKENKKWKPIIGMIRSNVRASVEEGVHRMLNHHVPNGPPPPPPRYFNVPPPNYLRQLGNYDTQSNNQNTGRNFRRNGFSNTSNQNYGNNFERNYRQQQQSFNNRNHNNQNNFNNRRYESHHHRQQSNRFDPRRGQHNRNRR